MAFTIAEANAVNTVLDWLAHITLWEHDTPPADDPDVDPFSNPPGDQALRRALELLAVRAHRALGAGVTQADAEAIAVHLFDNGPDS